MGILSRKNEEERLEAAMMDAFRSPLSLEVTRAQEKLIARSRTKPLETVTLLLRHYDHEDGRVRQSVKETLVALSKNKACMGSVLTDMVHPDRNLSGRPYKNF